MKFQDFIDVFNKNIQLYLPNVLSNIVYGYLVKNKEYIEKEEEEEKEKEIVLFKHWFSYINYFRSIINIELDSLNLSYINISFTHRQIPKIGCGIHRTIYVKFNLNNGDIYVNGNTKHYVGCRFTKKELINALKNINIQIHGNVFVNNKLISF